MDDADDGLQAAALSSVRYTLDDVDRYFPVAYLEWVVVRAQILAIGATLSWRSSSITLPRYLALGVYCSATQLVVDRAAKLSPGGPGPGGS